MMGKPSDTNGDGMDSMGGTWHYRLYNTCP